MPVHQSSDVGDLFVRIDIDFPASLTEEQREGIFNIFYLSCYITV